MTLNLAPMVDVMMCLIVFFLLAARIVDSERRPLDLPYAAAAREVPPDKLGRRVTINVLPAGEQAAEAEYVVQAWDGRRLIDRRLSAAQVGDYLRRRAALAARSGEQLRCLIRADENVAYGHVEVVLRACGRAGLGQIVFAARSTPGK